MKDDAFFLVCGVVCLWPLLWAAIGYFVGHYRPRLRSPIVIDDRNVPLSPNTVPKMRRVEDKIGLGGPGG